MTEKKKVGRPSQHKVWKAFTLDQEVIDYINSLPDGDRSRFVNSVLTEKIKHIREQNNRSASNGDQ